MARKNYLVGMDIGTSQVRVVVGEIQFDGTVNIIGVGVSPSEGIKKGTIIDLDKTVASVALAVEEAERMVGYKIEAAFVGLTGLNIDLINNRGVVAVSSDDKEIREEDVARVLQATRVIALPADREIVDIIPREYIVDGYSGIRDPIGMLGVRLEVDAMIITSPITSLRNLVRCVNRAGVNVKGLILSSLAAAEISLTADERELGVFLLDFGAGTTEIAFFQHEKLKHLTVLPIGGDHITSDLAVGLRTSHLTAEGVKIDRGCAMVSMADGNAITEIRNVGGKTRREVSEKEVARFIEPRVLEILQLAKNEMVKMGWQELPPAGVVLTGGVSSMKGALELARLFFNSDEQVRLAEPGGIGMKNNPYTTAVGMIYYVQRRHPVGFSQGRDRLSKKSGIFQRIKEWLSDFLE